MGKKIKKQCWDGIGNSPKFKYLVRKYIHTIIALQVIPFTIHFAT